MSYTELEAVGPLQRDEALALFGIVRALAPKTVVEFGFYHGHSAFNFLQAMEMDSKIFSFDISEESAIRATQEFPQDPRFAFLHKSQTDFTPEDVENRTIDFVFFDAAHDLSLNVETFEKLLPSLAPTCTIAIHDTGLWIKSHFKPVHHEFVAKTGHSFLAGNQYPHQPDERKFVNWICKNHPAFVAIHLHSTNTLRHGITLLQRSESVQ